MGKHNGHTKEIELSSRTPAKSAAVRLQQIVDGLRTGSLRLQHGEEAIAMMPSDAVEMRFRAKQKNQDERLAIELRWRRDVRPDHLHDLQIENDRRGKVRSRGKTTTPNSSGRSTGRTTRSAAAAKRTKRPGRTGGSRTRSGGRSRSSAGR